MRRGPNIKIQKTGAQVTANSKVLTQLPILSVRRLEAIIFSTAHLLFCIGIDRQGWYFT
jgi:hypothetical protein